MIMWFNGDDKLLDMPCVCGADSLIRLKRA